MRTLIRILLAGLLFACIARSTWGDEPAYEEKLAAARRLAAEKSWALAREAFTAARGLAPDDEADRWCALWVADADWRAKSWTGMRDLEAFDAAVGFAAMGGMTDDYGVAVRESRIAMLSKVDPRAALLLMVETADALGSAPHGAEAARRYLAFLQRVVAPRLLHGVEAELARWTEHVTRAADLASAPEARAELAMELGRIALGWHQGPYASRRMLLHRAGEMARGTTREAALGAVDWTFLVEHGTAGDDVPGKNLAPDAMIERLRACEAVLEGAVEPFLVELRQRLAAFRRWWTSPMLFVDSGNEVAAGGRFEFRYGCAHTGRLECMLYRIDGFAGALELEAGAHHASYGMPSRSFPVTAEAALLWKDTIATGGPDATWRTGTVPVPVDLAPGFYALVVRPEEGAPALLRVRRFLVASVGALAVSSSDEPTRLQLFERDSGAPLADRDVQLGYRVGAHPDVQVKELHARTDAEGFVDVPAARTQGNVQHQAIAGFVGGQPFAVIRVNFDDEPRDVVADLFVDRELFRPGETIHWKLILRERREGLFVLPDELLLVSVVHSGRRDDVMLVENQILLLDRFGSTHGRIELPATLPPGTATLEIRAQRGDEWVEVGRAALARVENIVAPALKASVELASGPESLQPGRIVRFRVRAVYASGGPAAGVAVRGTWTETTHRDMARGDFRVGEDALERQTSPLHGETDAEGAAEFSVRLGSGGARGVAIDVEAFVLPEGGQAVPTEATWQAVEGGLVVSTVESEPQWILPGEPVEFIGHARDGCGAPSVFDGVARLVRIQWEEAWLAPDRNVVSGAALAAERERLGLLPDEELPEPWAKVMAETTETPGDIVAVQCGADGRVRARFESVAPGGYRVQWLRKDVDVSGGVEELPRRPGRRDFVVVHDGMTQGLDFAPGAAHLLLRAWRPESGKLEGLAVVPERAERAWVVIDGEQDHVLHPLHLRGRIATFSIDEVPAIAGEALVRVMWPDEAGGLGSLRWATARISGPRLTSPIALALETEDEVRPGSPGRIRLRASDDKGRPVSVAIAVSDEAVNRVTRRAVRESTTFDTCSAWEAALFSVSRAVRAHAEAAHVRDVRPGVERQLVRRRLGDVDWEREDPSGFEGPGERDTRSFAASGMGGGAAFGTPDPMAAAALAQRDGIRIRRHFQATAFWSPETQTDGSGEARLEFTYPDNLTEWRIEAYAIGGDARSFGRATTFTRASLPFQARLQAPRFLIVGDTAELGGEYVNRSAADVRVHRDVSVDGGLQCHLGGMPADIRVEGASEARESWQVKATAPGWAALTLAAQAGEESDGVEIPLLVREDGVALEYTVSGLLRAGHGTQSMRLELPSEFVAARTEASLFLSAGHVAPLVDALPYLVHYPHGCVEQTVSRFLPAVVARGIVARYGIDTGALDARIFATRQGIARGDSDAGAASIDEVVGASLDRLASARIPHDGFGWWPGASESDPWMTAYVLWGLATARETGIDVPDTLIQGTVQDVSRTVLYARQWDDTSAWGFAALARAGCDWPAEPLAAAFARAFSSRDVLSASGRAALALAAARYGSDEQKAILLRNLENGAQAVRGATGIDSVSWGASGPFGRAMDNPVEVTALTLMALLALDPDHPLIAPAVNWLEWNRRSDRWSSTRDTALAVVALAAHLAGLGPVATDEVEVEILVDGTPVGRATIDGRTLLAGGVRLPIDVAALRPGENRIELRRVRGDAPVFAAAIASVWVPGGVIAPTGHRASVTREFLRHREQPTVAGPVRIERAPLTGGDAVAAGEVVTVRVLLSVSESLEYIMVEVPRPAGCEPFHAVSGWDARLVEPGAAPSDRPDPEDTEGAIYREEHDDRSVFYINSLAAGEWEIVYRLRANTPGDFRVFPATLTAMYVPEIRASSEARRVRIEPRRGRTSR